MDEIAPRLETQRLVLRAPRASDLSCYTAFYADAEASRFYGGPLRRDQAWRILAQDIGHWQLRAYGMWMLETRDEGRVVGGCGLWWPEGWPRHELTWWLLPGDRGSGLATEASRTVLAWAGRELGWPTVETHFDDENLAVRRLVERLGGRKIAREPFPDGIDRDVYSMPTGGL